MKGYLRLRLPRAHHVKGFSLIELMISLAIGLVMMVVVFSAYLGASAAGRIAEAQGRMNEDAQAALSVLTQQLRMAGNNPIQFDRTAESPRNPVYKQESTGTAYYSSFMIRGCGEKFNTSSLITNLDDLKCSDGGGYSANAIAVSYEADVFNTVSTVEGEPTDCLGAKLPKIKNTAGNPSYPDYNVAENRFYIDVSPDKVPSLYCKGNGLNDNQESKPAPLVENIEDLQFTYGVVVTAGDLKTASISGYLQANKFMEKIALPDDAARWARVVAVRICIVARSEARVATDLASARYTKCNGEIETAPPDLRLRRAYTTTVVLRNRRL